MCVRMVSQPSGKDYSDIRYILTIWTRQNMGMSRDTDIPSDTCRAKHKLTLKVFSLKMYQKSKPVWWSNSFFCMEQTLQPSYCCALWKIGQPYFTHRLITTSRHRKCRAYQLYIKDIYIYKHKALTARERRSLPWLHKRKVTNVCLQRTKCIFILF